MPQNSTALEPKASSAPSALCWAKEKYSGFFRAEYGGKVEAMITMLCDHFENHKETIFENTEHQFIVGAALKSPALHRAATRNGKEGNARSSRAAQQMQAAAHKLEMNSSNGRQFYFDSTAPDDKEDAAISRLASAMEMVFRSNGHDHTHGNGNPSPIITEQNILALVSRQAGSNPKPAKMGESEMNAAGINPDFGHGNRTCNGTVLKHAKSKGRVRSFHEISHYAATS